LTINKKVFLQLPDTMYKDSILIFSINPKILTPFINPDSKYFYFKGGDTVSTLAYTIDKLNHYIPNHEFTENGISITGELLIRNGKGKLIDSLTIIDNYSPQISVNGYNFTPASVPLSTPAQTSDKADVKWSFFGFPFNNVYADTVFHYFGGRKNMKDGEWIIYKYDPSANSSFSVFNDEQFQAGSAYFVAQALVDTFKISNS
jgi:hypothetical protein